MLEYCLDSTAWSVVWLLTGYLLGRVYKEGGRQK